jgi:N-acetylmuramoyl-L-alanine amidase
VDIQVTGGHEGEALVARTDVGVIKGVRVPTVLVETCFLTNEEDAALAASEAWIALMAEGICRGIDNYFVQSEQGA